MVTEDLCVSRCGARDGAGCPGTRGGFWLDDADGVLYGGGGKHIAAATTARLSESTTEDTPHTSLQSPPGLTQLQESDRFQTYLMYKPIGTDCRSVPLSQMEWHWAGAAVNSTNGWALSATGTDASVNPAGQEWFSPPQWTNGVSQMILQTQ